jgi:hypothetical protein
MSSGEGDLWFQEWRGEKRHSRRLRKAAELWLTAVELQVDVNQMWGNQVHVTSLTVFSILVTLLQHPLLFRFKTAFCAGLAGN